MQNGTTQGRFVVCNHGGMGLQCPLLLAKALFTSALYSESYLPGRTVHHAELFFPIKPRTPQKNTEQN